MKKTNFVEKQEVDLTQEHEKAIREIYSCKFHKKIAIAKNLLECEYLKRAPYPYNSYHVSMYGDFVVNEFNGYIKISSRRKDGYRGFNLYNQDTGKQQILFAHRLVALTYLPQVKDKNEVDHIDRNRKNNSLENLRWANRQEQIENRSFKKK